MIDLDRVRADTAGCEDIIHLNNAGSALPPRQVVDAMVDYLRDEELCGGYEVYNNRLDELDLFYSSTAELLNCAPADVAFTTSGSDGWWRAFSSVPLAPGDRVLVGRSEYQTNAYGWLQARERGVEVEVVPNTADGDFDVDALAGMLDDRVALVSLTMIALSNGAVHPAAEVGELLADHRAIYLLDACQAAGQIKLDVSELGCDFLTYTGRKFLRGPRGTGVLYANPDVLDQLDAPTHIDGLSAAWTSDETYSIAAGARRFEAFEIGFGSKLGLAVATDYANTLGIDAIEARVTQLSSRFRKQLTDAGMTVLDEGTKKSGIVTFNVDGIDAATVRVRLGAQGINVSTPLLGQARLDMGPRGIDQLVRAGVHYYNTEDELDRTIDALREL